jgi:predicted RNase H-like HicB family nuclease
VKTIKAVQTHFTIIFEAAEEGGYTAYVPEVPRAISEGETLDEAREMVMSALEEVLDARRELAIQQKTDKAIVESIKISA